MKIVQINTFPNKATGNIMMNLHCLLMKNGMESYVVWGRGRDAVAFQECVMKDIIGVTVHGIFTRITDRTGFASRWATKKLINKLKEIKPDIIHLHNLHGYYINIEMLFTYIKVEHIKVVWTFHDCWPVTGHCAYFDRVMCNKWKTGCYNCVQTNAYPASYFIDSSEWNWKKKKELYTGIDMTIVTPSHWLKRISEQSFVKEYPIQVIYNGIDLEVFKPVSSEKVYDKYLLSRKPIVLGVASEWTERKGLKDFIILSKLLPEVQVVIVGVTKKQLKKLPNSVKGICRTDNVRDLVELYSAATVFFNPTYEDNLPTTLIEALACGTPVVTYDTGGSPEIVEIGNKIANNIIGMVIKKQNANEVNFEEVLKVIRMMTDMTTLKFLGMYSVAEDICFENISEKSEIDMVKQNYLREYDIIHECRKAAEFFNVDERLKDYLCIYKKMMI